MSHDSDLRERLERLEALLLRYRPGFQTGTDDVTKEAASPINTTFERLRHLAMELQRNSADSRLDTLDIVTIRVMLEDYASALSHLRASVHTAEQQLSSVAATVADGHRIVREERKRRRE